MSITDKREQPMLKVHNLQVQYGGRKGLFGQPARRPIRAVDGISFDIAQGKTVGLVGESGCGKSSVGYAVMGLTRATAGSVEIAGEDITQLPEAELRKRRRNMQMVFQDPFSSLNPRISVGEIVAEPIRVHRLRDGEAAVRNRVQELLGLVGLDASAAKRLPHEFSGGQRQRIGIARALAVEPRLIVCDEAVSALDVSVQAQVINLLMDLQQQLGLTYLFISHGLAVVSHISDRVAVMYLGKIVEIADTALLYVTPRHPYTLSLFSAAPVPDPDVELSRKQIILSGDLPSPLNPPSGCRFHTRCPIAVEKCRSEEPPLETLVAGHQVACWRANEAPRLMTIAAH